MARAANSQHVRWHALAEVQVGFGGTASSPPGWGCASHVNTPGDPASGFVETYPVAFVEAGGGVAAQLRRGLFIGGELTFDTGTDFYQRGINGQLSLFNLRVVTGWSF